MLVNQIKEQLYYISFHRSAEWWIEVQYFTGLPFPFSCNLVAISAIPSSRHEK